MDKVELRTYTRAWPVRANPLIVELFSATDTEPLGDTTAWCAAFVNWCIKRAHTGRSDTHQLLAAPESAASGKFREWARAVNVEDASPGDIAVFELIAQGRPHPWRGHVAFFGALESRYVKVLGGNQFEGKPLKHAINEKLMAYDGSILKLHSIRTDPSLHAV